jgi:hypothetical protein
MREGEEDSHAYVLKISEPVSLTFNYLNVVINSLHFSISCAVVEIVANPIKMVFDSSNNIGVNF